MCITIFAWFIAKFHGLWCMVPGYRFRGGLSLYSVSCTSLIKNSSNTKVVFNHFDLDSYIYIYMYIIYNYMITIDLTIDFTIDFTIDSTSNLTIDHRFSMFFP